MPNKVIRPGSKGGLPSRKDLYKKCAMKAYLAIDVLVEEMVEPSKMSGARVAAAKAVLAKVLPDLKAQEIDFGDKGVRVIMIPSDVNEKYDTSSNTKANSQESSSV